MAAWSESVQRLLGWAEARLPALTRYRQLEALPITLHRRRIYIVPSAFGLLFTVLLGIMLIGALNYANNAALLLSCLLGGASVASMLIAFRNLDGLRVTSIQPGHAMAGEPVMLQIHLDAATRVRQAVMVDLNGQTEATSIVPPHVATMSLALPTRRRGWQALPRIRVWTHWPIGLFRAWSWLHPSMQVLVWPRPESGGPPPTFLSDDPLRQRLHRGEDLAALRDYRAGDPPRHIAWKASARHESLLVKDFEQPAPHEDWQLDWRQLPELGQEARISRLARWLSEAEASGRATSLWLPEERIERGVGPAHFARCMNALAKLP
ncbi:MULTISPECIES: DUF58 domain-containing protein [Dyella]|uniref:DUF58 domain-containing protein n=2 Tax=Dyella TaxID=231454 RepID=A0A4R0YV67_9GAMM|nr:MULTISPECIES: DUF58 domain-containing protein [Dyella]TBR39181.1 DUF58 domain-containing protein [Dyella terrae]TCI13232.1 DUF58 domain-containing protein [Dyella soli]